MMMVLIPVLILSGIGFVMAALLAVGIAVVYLRRTQSLQDGERHGC